MFVLILVNFKPRALFGKLSGYRVKPHAEVSARAQASHGNITVLSHLNCEPKKSVRQIVACKLAQIKNLSEIDVVMCRKRVFRDRIPVLPCVSMLTTRSGPA